MDEQNKHMWTAYTAKLLRKYGLHDVWADNAYDMQQKSRIKLVIHECAEREWQSRMEDKDTLSDYRRMKKNLQCEEYVLQQTMSKGRVALTRLRADVSGLRVDTGRWEYMNVDGKHQRLPRSMRTCMLCAAAVEDAKHLLCHCPVYKNERQTLLQDCVENIDDIAHIVQDGAIVDADLFCDLAMYGPGVPYVKRYLANAMEKRADRLQIPIIL